MSPSGYSRPTGWVIARSSCWNHGESLLALPLELYASPDYGEIGCGLLGLFLAGFAAMGELALDGRLRAVPGVLPAAVAAAHVAMGFM